jgi:DNA-binding transcriptional LysR family regulator
MQRMNLNRVASLESFFAVAQMALAGFGHGLVPIGVARTLGIAQNKVLELDKSGLTRPVRFVARKSMFAQELVRSFYNEVSRLAAEIEGD